MAEDRQQDPPDQPQAARTKREPSAQVQAWWSKAKAAAAAAGQSIDKAAGQFSDAVDHYAQQVRIA